MVPNVESVYGITSKVVTTTIGVNRSPRERIFLQKSNSSSWLLRNFGFKIRNYHKNCQASKFKYPCQKAVWRVYPGTHWFLGINIYLEELFGWCNYRNYYFVSLSTCGSWSYRAKIKIWNLVWIAEIQVCSCVGYTENQKFDLLQDEFQLNLPIIILPMRVVTCSISSQESELSQFRMRLWNFDVIPTSTTYLEVLEMSTVCVFNYGWKIQISRYWLPPVADLPLQKFKTKIAHKIEKIRETAITSSPPLVWFSSVDHHHSWLVSFLGFKKTGCRRRNVLKEDLGAEDKIRKLVSSLWARLPGYGQKRPRYQWVPGYPMVWDMECLV